MTAADITLSPPPAMPGNAYPILEALRDMAEQELYLVFGGRVEDPPASEYVDPAAVDIRSIYPSYERALEVWRSASQSSVDDAFIKYIIVRLRRPTCRRGAPAAAARASYHPAKYLRA